MSRHLGRVAAAALAVAGTLFVFAGPASAAASRASDDKRASVEAADIDKQIVEAKAEDDQGDQGDQDGKVKIKPFNDCYVKHDDGSVTSYFGYELESPAQATLQAGTSANSVSGANANSGQPSSFTSGKHNLVFSVTWRTTSPEPVWSLNGEKAKATSSGSVCREIPAVPEFPIALVGPLVAVAAFGSWFIVRRRQVAPAHVLG